MTPRRPLDEIPGHRSKLPSLRSAIPPTGVCEVFGVLFSPPEDREVAWKLVRPRSPLSSWAQAGAAPKLHQEEGGEEVPYRSSMDFIPTFYGSPATNSLEQP